MNPLMHITGTETQGSVKWQDLSAVFSACAVDLRGAQQVQSYLETHVDMFKIVEKICRATREEFGTEAELAIQMVRDPEIQDEHLTLYVRQSKYFGDILPRIRSLLDPYDDELCMASGSVLVTTDFVDARGENGLSMA